MSNEELEALGRRVGDTVAELVREGDYVAVRHFEGLIPSAVFDALFQEAFAVACDRERDPEIRRRRLA